MIMFRSIFKIKFLKLRGTLVTSARASGTSPRRSYPAPGHIRLDTNMEPVRRGSVKIVCCMQTVTPVSHATVHHRPRCRNLKFCKCAYHLDVEMSFFGMRFGWVAVIGSIPEIGDTNLIYILYTRLL
jgi:hypothetical protein